MVSKSTYDKSIVIISAMSVVIALAASVSTTIQAVDGHKQNVINNDSSLGFDIDTDERDDRFGISLRNVGPGKVHINAVIYYVDNKNVDSIESAIEAAKLESNKLRIVDLTDDWMGAGELVPIFRYKASSRDERDKAATFVEEHLEVAIDYCTVGGRCETKCSERGRCGNVQN